MKTKHFRQQGFSLIELMLAVGISVFILAGVLTLMTASKRTYSYQQQMARMQENARFAADFIGHGLRMTGYFGCSQSSLYNPDVSGPDYIEELAILVGEDAVGVNNSDVFMVSYMETDRNGFYVRHCHRDMSQDNAPHTRQNSSVCLPVELNITTAGNYEPSPLREGLGNGTSGNGIKFGPTLFGTNQGPLSAYDPNILLGASDCVYTHVYRLASITVPSSTPGEIHVAYPYQSNPASSAVGLQRTYNNQETSYGAEMLQIVTERFYVALNSDGEPALFRDNGIFQDGSTPSDCDTPPSSFSWPDIAAAMVVTNCYAEELIAGVESMQVRWGVNTNADPFSTPEQYVRAVDINTDPNLRWNQVVSAEITLLMRTDARFDRDPDTGTYVLDPADASTNFTPTTTEDQARRRAIFRTVVELRNQTLQGAGG